MSRLTFRNKNLKALLVNAKTQWEKGVLKSYVDGGPTVPAFWLIGDEGVYLMHNGASSEGKRQPLAYAEECNPETLSFDDWWETKRATFGGDDGVELVPRDLIETIVGNGSDLVVEFSPGQMELKEMVRR